MPWSTIAEFDLTQAWQTTAPIDGRIFRVRHIDPPFNSRALIAQASLDGQTLQLFDQQRLTPKIQHDLFDFLPPLGLESRCIAVKLIAFEQSSWTIAIDVLEPEDPQEEADLLAWLQQLIDTKEDAGIALSLLSGHMTAEHPHTQYATDAEVVAAIAAHAAFDNAHPAAQTFHTLTTPANSATFHEVVNPSRLVLSNNSSVLGGLWVIGRQAGTGASQFWSHDFAARRGASASATAILWNSRNRRYGDTTSFDYELFADTVNGAIGIRCRSGATQTTGTNWKIYSRLVEVA